MAQAEEDYLNLVSLKKRLTGQVLVKESDIEGELYQEVQDIVASGIENNITPSLNSELASKYVKEALDKKYGPYWHVIIGEGFAFNVTKQQKSLMFMFFNGNIAILVYKT